MQHTSTTGPSLSVGAVARPPRSATARRMLWTFFLGALWGSFWFVFGSLLVLLTGCSALIGPESEPVLYCHATKEPIQCPTDPQAARRAVRVFAEHVLPLSEDEPLIIHWYDWDEEFGDRPGDVVGYALTGRFPQEVHVRGTSVLMHELTHVALDRAVGDADPNHEEPPGPWGEAMNSAIERASKAYGVTNATEMP